MPSFYPESSPHVIKISGNLTVLRHPAGHLCGYCRFPTRPVKEPGYNGILRYIPVHGGITYASADSAGMVYGFDCNHLDDVYRPDTRDPDWALAEADRLHRAIIIAATLEDLYLIAKEDQRINVLEYLCQLLEEEFGEWGQFHPTQSFGIMLALLSGRP